MRGTQAAPDAVRILTCWACRLPFTQRGPGRNRLTCGAPRCERKRRHYQRESLAALDRVEG